MTGFNASTRKNIVQEKLFELTDEWIEGQKSACHRRLSVFAFKGTTCVSCDRVGTHVKHWYVNKKIYENRLESKSGHSGLHVDIVGFDKDGQEFMMTVDHVKPKSKGGSDQLSNLQPMCEECNAKKGASYA